jgi:hypothetical protein
MSSGTASPASVAHGRINTIRAPTFVPQRVNTSLRSQSPSDQFHPLSSVPTHLFNRPPSGSASGSPLPDMKVGQKRAREVGADDLIRKQYVQEIARIKTSLINMQDSWHAWEVSRSNGP